MKAGNGILDADMATIGRWARAVVGWWIEELAGLVPARLRRTGRPPRHAAIFDGTPQLTLFEADRPVEWTSSVRRRGLDLAIAERHALVREIAMPSLSRSEVRQMVALEIDRLFPLPSQLLTVDAIIAGTPAPGRSTVRVAALPNAVVNAALAAAADRGIAPSRVSLAQRADSRAVEFDFAPALRADGRLPPRTNERLVWWSLVAAVFILNVGLLVLRDQQSVDHLATLVDQQAPAVSVARLMTRRAEQVTTLSRLVVERRRRHDALRDLGTVTTLLGDGAWVQRLMWDGASIRMEGYKQPTFDLVAQLRRSPRLASVRLTTSDVIAELPVGQPFDVAAELRDVAR